MECERFPTIKCITGENDIFMDDVVTKENLIFLLQTKLLPLTMVAIAT